MHIGWSQILIATVTLACGGEAAALGFGQIRSSVVLGQPLNLAIPVTLSAGETIGTGCTGAEVSYGETQLPPISVRVRMTLGVDGNESVLRVNTTTVIDEPVVTVTLSAGCPTRISRTLVLLADPPLVTVAAAPAERIPVGDMAPQPAAPMAAPQSASSPAPPRAARATPPKRAARASRTASPPRAAVAEAASAASASGGGVASAPRPFAQPAESKSRLRLDAGQAGFEDAAANAAQEQASAARATAIAAEAAASAASARVRAMEGDVSRMLADAKAETAALLQLRQQLALDRALRDEPSRLVLVLLALVALFAALATWLAWRLRKQARTAPARVDWWQHSASVSMDAPTAEPSVAQSEPAPPSAPGTLRRVPSAPAPWSDEVDSRSGDIDLLIAPPTVPAPTAVPIPSLPPLLPVVSREEQARGAMSVDEQIDLEQQADFFIALGHDDAAIDLLMAHMRSTGGSSPLPFLKLLEIHRRRGHREAYDRTRVRFNQRFNGVAPEWQADPKLGRGLEDYTLAIGRVQRAWPSPLDAIAELEALLFRRGPEAELFDLPAYHDVVFLYLIARDLHAMVDRGGVDDVDVLLPIGGRSAPIIASAGTIVLRPEFNDGNPVSLDLDLTTRHDQAALAQVESESPPADGGDPHGGSADAKR
jgi:pilus assembly protein FimV